MNREHGREHEMNHEEGVERKRKSPMKLTLAHFNPKELDHFDEEQGGRSEVPGTDTPHYKRLEIVISQPGGSEHFNRAFERHASGGMVGEKARHIRDLQRKGRFGDTKMAYIGPKHKELLDRALYDLTGTKPENNKNPHTGHPEYYGLSSFFGGIGKGLNKFGRTMQNGFNSAGSTLGGMSNEFLGHLKDAAMPALQGALQGGLEGGPEGALMGAGMGGMQGFGQSLMSPSNQGQLSQMAQSNAGQQMMGAGASAYDRNNQGQNWQNNLASTVQQGTMGMNNPYAQSMNTAAQNYGASGNFGQAARAGLGHLSQMQPSNPYAQAGNAAAQNYGATSSPGHAASAGIGKLMNGNMHNPMMSKFGM